MKKILVIAIIYLLGSFAAAAQTVKVNGTVIDEQNGRWNCQCSPDFLTRLFIRYGKHYEWKR